MDETLIIFLHTQDLMRPSWVILDADLNPKQYKSDGQIDELTLASIDKKIIVLIPTEDVLLTSVVLPKTSRSRLLQVLPYALEEQLTNEIDTLHFVSADESTDRGLPVAVVSKDKMQEWVALLESWNIQADILTPLLFAIPFEMHAWHIVIKNEIANVRMNFYEGFVCDKMNLNQLLNIALLSINPVPHLIHIHHYSAQSNEKALNVNIPVAEHYHHPEIFFTELATQIVKLPKINLLQGAYRVKKSRFAQREKIWRANIFLAMAWVLLLFIYPTVSYFLLAPRIHSLELQIEQIYRHQFPQASDIVAPKLRMEEKLKKLTNEKGKNKFLILVAYVSKGIANTPNLKLNRLDFQNNQLTLALTANSSDDIAKFTDYLTQQNLRIKQQNANLMTMPMSATLVIE